MIICFLQIICWYSIKLNVSDNHRKIVNNHKVVLICLLEPSYLCVCAFMCVYKSNSAREQTGALSTGDQNASWYRLFVVSRSWLHWPHNHALFKKHCSTLPGSGNNEIEMDNQTNGLLQPALHPPGWVRNTEKLSKQWRINYKIRGRKWG